MRRPTLSDIDALLDEGRLVFVTVNSRALNGQKGFASHALLVIKNQDGQYVVHDPGLPPRPFRKLEPKRLWKAMGGQTNTSEVTAFKLAAPGPPVA